MSANGQHAVFETGGTGGQSVSPQEMLDVWVYLIELFDRAVGDLQAGNPIWGTGGELATTPIPMPTDAEVEAQMETYLRPIASYTDNWMYLAK